MLTSNCETAVPQAKVYTAIICTCGETLLKGSAALIALPGWNRLNNDHFEQLLLYLRLTLKDNDTCLCACCMGNYSIKTIGATVLSEFVINICDLITFVIK